MWWPCGVAMVLQGTAKRYHTPLVSKLHHGCGCGNQHLGVPPVFDAEREDRGQHSAVLRRCALTFWLVGPKLQTEDVEYTIGDDGNVLAAVDRERNGIGDDLTAGLEI